MKEDTTRTETEAANEPEEKSFFQIIVHSFFIIPFLIAVFCCLLFAGVHLLTDEKRTVYDYLEDVKIGGLDKRWQGAFELSKILANPKHIPTEPRFVNELTLAFEKSEHDENPHVQQYLALAMGRTQNTEFSLTLRNALKNVKPDVLPAIIYSLGMLGDKAAVEDLSEYTTHQNSRVRSLSVAALGTLGQQQSKPILKKALFDKEPNVQWGAAVALARLKDSSGKDVLLNLLSREYLSQFPEVDSKEKTQLILSGIDASTHLNDSKLNEIISQLAKTDTNMKIRAAALEYSKK